MSLLPLLGVAILVALFADVFLTVFHPEGKGGPISRRQNRGVWMAVRRLGLRLEGDSRDRWLSFAGPALPVLTFISWEVLLLAGYTLIYLPSIDSFLASPGSIRGGWAEAVYYSGYTAATLGVGDLVADSEALRLVTVLQALAGFALISVAVTYLLAVYRELILMKTLASNIAGYLRPGPERTLRIAVDNGSEALIRWTEGITAELLHVRQSHFQYPILHYFRASDRAQALPVQLGALLRMTQVAEADGAPREYCALAENPSFRALSDALAVYLRDVDELFIPASFAAERAAPGGSRAEEAHQRLASFMVYH